LVKWGAVGIQLQQILETAPCPHHYLFLNLGIDFFERNAQVCFIWKKGGNFNFEGLVLFIPIAVLLVEYPSFDGIGSGVKNDTLEQIQF